MSSIIDVPPKEEWQARVHGDYARRRDIVENPRAETSRRKYHPSGNLNIKVLLMGPVRSIVIEESCEGWSAM